MNYYKLLGYSPQEIYILFKGCRFIIVQGNRNTNNCRQISKQIMVKNNKIYSI